MPIWPNLHLSVAKSGENADGDKNPNNVAGGLKAWVLIQLNSVHYLLTYFSTLNNPNVSDEAKESAKERLNQM